jgi:hypothetical protein
VQYDRDKELYYADISLRTPKGNPPFVQLAVARYQPLAIDGAALSDVTVLDPIRLPGDRELLIERNPLSPEKFEITLKGPFPTGPEPLDPLPRREVSVELRKRAADQATEIEGPLANLKDTEDLDYSESALDDRFPSSDVMALERQTESGHYHGVCEFSFPRRGQNGLYLRVVEREIYQTEEPQRDKTGDKSRRVGITNASDWVPFTCAINIA